MIVVADTSPLNYLLQIGCESVLPALYERIVVPSAVLAELSHPDTPAAVSSWLLHSPHGSKFGVLLPRLMLHSLLSTLANAKRFSWPRNSVPNCC
jgi:hypothetical protein